MASRHLPTRHNHLMTEEVPTYADLVSRRRLGQTQLTARMVATIPGTEIDSSNLGVFDYAHLRAPLPKGIVSGIFKGSPNSYFLMRRSQDGYVSATGMFKATFPYADAEEEELERKYIKSQPTTSEEETAGNVWIPAKQALDLAQEYNVLPWIQALLDPTDIPVSAGSSGDPPKKIVAPPKFFHGVAPPTPSSLPRSSRARRSVSPSKSSTSKRAPASPRKRKAAASSSSTSSTSPALTNGDHPSLIPVPISPVEKEIVKIQAVGDALAVEATKKEADIVLAPVEEEPKVKVHVDQDVKVDEDGKEVTSTKVEVELPLAGEPPSAEEAARLIAEAREMVKAATESAGVSLETSAKSKRKADDITADGDDEAATGETAVAAQPAPKRPRTEVELRKQRMKTRAYVGISATLAVGALTTYFMGLF